MGGHLTASGNRVRTGLLYRSTALNRLDGDDAAAFARLGVRSVYDLRTAEERRNEPDRLPPGTEYVVVDVIAGWSGGPSFIAEAFRNPRSAERILGGGRAAALWHDQYRQFVVLQSASEAYGRLFRDIALELHRPALFHCSTGKDRTGWAAASFLLLLDVPYEAVLEDYLASATYLRPMVGPFIDEFAARGGDPELLRPILGVEPSYLEAGLAEVHRLHGSFERYFAEALGVDADMQAAIRRTFLVGAQDR